MISHNHTFFHKLFQILDIFLPFSRLSLEPFMFLLTYRLRSKPGVALIFLPVCFPLFLVVCVMNLKAGGRLSSHIERSPNIAWKYLTMSQREWPDMVGHTKWTLVLCKNFHLKLIRPLNRKFNKTQKPEFRWSKPFKNDFEYFLNQFVKTMCNVKKFKFCP